MDLRINSIVIWPKNPSKSVRRVLYHIDKVNVISGDSERGKSAIISIIDYCLGSSKCTIPSGIIRELSSWFGVILAVNGYEILLARKEPEGEKVSNEYFKAEESSIDIPDKVEANYHLDDIKKVLNNNSNLTDLDFSENEKIGFKGAPSFRDLVPLNFQPQYIVANPFTLFYKTDSYEHRETFKSVLPYILGVIDDRTLQLKEELKVLKREESRKLSELVDRRKVVENWITEIKTYFNVAQELGLIDDSVEPKEDWGFITYFEHLRKVPDYLKNDNTIILNEGSSTKSANRAASLRDREYIISSEIQSLKEKLILINNLGFSNNAYRASTEKQIERIKGVGWLADKIQEKSNCQFCGQDSTDSKEYIKNVESLKNKLDTISNKISDSRKVLGREAISLQSRLKEKERELNGVRLELKNLETEDEEYRLSRQTINSIFYFTGQLDQALKNYYEASNESMLVEELEGLRERIDQIESEINDEAIAKKKESALLSVGKLINHYANIFIAERASANIKLDIEHLSLKFLLQDGREFFLWQIGSGHNHVAYHISTILAIHEFLLDLDDNKVSQFIVFDQPSQAYFPEGISNENPLSSDDLARLKRIFEALEEFVNRTSSKVQVIVLEHAGEETWSELENIRLIKRWRDGEADNALIPAEWRE